MKGRIACVHLPSFPLQVRAREQPKLAGRAVAIAEPSPRRAILVCSRAARDEGVRSGMTPLQARALVPNIDIFVGDPEAEYSAACALAEALMSLSTTVDLGPAPGASSPAHRSIYLRVPRTARRRHLRGARFGEEILKQCSRLGYRARVGIADDRFTAWTAATCGNRGAASFSRACTVVPRGGASAFLAPLPIDLLPAGSGVLAMLRALGVHTLGDFAALPAPTVGRRWQESGIDLQALTRGDGPTLLTPFLPSEAIREAITVDDEITAIEPLSFVLRPLADRVCERLRGRGTAAACLRLTLGGPGGARTAIELSPSRAIASGHAIADLARAHLAERALEHPITELTLEIKSEVEPELETLDLFDRRGAEVAPEAIDAAIARLRAAFGEDAACAAELVDTHRPEGAYRLVPFSPPHRDRAPRRPRKRSHARAHADSPLPPALSETAGALRLVDPPAPQSSNLESIEIEGKRRRVIAARGPTRIAVDWWSEVPLDRDYYEVETDDGGRYWVFRDGKAGRYYLHGVFD